MLIYLLEKLITQNFILIVFRNRYFDALLKLRGKKHRKCFTAINQVLPKT